MTTGIDPTPKLGPVDSIARILFPALYPDPGEFSPAVPEPDLEASL